MRSDFWSLPYAARRAIQRGESAAFESDRQSSVIRRLEARIAELEKENAELRASIKEGSSK
jgi:uncharacterized protein YceH (UPF0502 family)